MEIKLFVFDMGDVIIYEHDTWHNVFAAFGIDASNVREFGPRSRAAIWKMITSDTPESWFWSEVQTELPKKVEWEGVLQSRHIGIDVPGTKDLIRDLKKKGYRVVCGTNNIRPFYQDIKAHGHYDIFDKTYSSFKIGYGKPDPDFWRYIAKEEGIELSEMFFVDDNAENIAAAASIGVQTFLFKESKDLRSLLEEKGIL